MTGTVTVNVTDDDSAAIVFTGAPVAVTEGAAGRVLHGGVGDRAVGFGDGRRSAATPALASPSALDDASLVFTTLNWATAQTVAVTAAGDDDGADESVVLTHTAQRRRLRLCDRHGDCER